MRRLTSVRILTLSAALVLLLAGRAQALTVRDIIDLTKAGLGDEVLLALIEVDGSLFSIDPQAIASLKAAGVSEKVIVALVRSGRTPASQAMAPSVAEAPPSPVAMMMPDPQVVYVERQPTTVVREVSVPVPVPVYVPVPVAIGHGRRGHVIDSNSTIEPSITAPIQLQGQRRNLTDTPPQPPGAKPVYWGNGGKLRPDAWGQPR